MFIGTKEEVEHKRKSFEVLLTLTVTITVVWDGRNMCYSKVK